MPFGQLKSAYRILIEVQYDTDWGVSPRFAAAFPGKLQKNTESLISETLTFARAAFTAPYWHIQEGSIELSLVLAGSFRLLLALQAGADIMLALFDLRDHALFCAAPLKTTQSALQRFVFLDANFRHCFPSLRWHPARSRMLSGPRSWLRILYMLIPGLSSGFS